MFSWLAKLVASCWKPVRKYARMSKDEEDQSDDDPLLWFRDICQHSLGEFSIGIVQANESIEDQTQVETCRNGTFVGIYDGHVGPDASRFISDHLFPHFIGLAREEKMISEDVLRNAFLATEEGFLAHVTKTRQTKPLIAAIGSCCLVGVIWHRTLYVANAGDSRAVLGYLGRSNTIVAEQLTREHNASKDDIRQELLSLHPDDSHIVVLKNGVWRVKGIIQVSRSIGDAYLKGPGFSLDQSFTRFWLPEPLHRPVLTAEPSIHTRVLLPQDKFIIFASDGLWEQLSNQEAVEIVYNYPREGIARRLIRAALQEAARKREVRYSDLKKIDRGVRRFFHDDISVVVIFLDHDMGRKKPNVSVPQVSVKGFVDTVTPSDFSVLEGIDSLLEGDQ